MMKVDHESKATQRRVGFTVIVILAVLTAVEFWVSLTLVNPLPYLFVIALVKASLIVYYFMHVAQIRHKEV
jgi:caa(3)-type oxidase subunit IV